MPWRLCVEKNFDSGDEITHSVWMAPLTIGHWEIIELRAGRSKPHRETQARLLAVLKRLCKI
jgi:hypothetical protein